MKKPFDISKRLSQAPNKETQDAITPDLAIELLKKGNQRFVNGLKVNRDFHNQITQTSSGQHPFAVVLGCIDSRVPAETVFDLGIGDVFIIRIAGNIVNGDILGSLEFACKVAGAKAIMVLGHTQCGAVKGACDNVQMGNLTGLLSKIKTAVNEVTDEQNRTSKNDSFVQKVAEINVHHVVASIPNQSEILAKMIADGNLKIIGGMYDVASGAVNFYD